MAFNTSRIFVLCGRPPRLAGGICALICSHSLSLKSLLYCFLIPLIYRLLSDFSNGLLHFGNPFIKHLCYDDTCRCKDTACRVRPKLPMTYLVSLYLARCNWRPLMSTRYSLQHKKL